MKSDIEIAQEADIRPIAEIASKLGLKEDEIEQYGKYKAKISDSAEIIGRGKKGKLILVTAITPTPAGEGKTTTSVGLADALSALGKKTVVALREPSLGPVFGIKGGAAGGGYAQVIPMEDINLHFTGDFHAIGAANNLLAAMLDNHIYQGNALGIDVNRIQWKRCVDMNDRQLRHIQDGLGGKTGGVPRDDGFDITAASEVMATLCLADGLSDLKERLSKIVVAFDKDGRPVTAGMLNAQGAMAALLKDAVKPNLVQTLENTPAIIHGGPFANIAHGCNSLIATRTALALGDYVVTEAGFGSDLGAEKFCDIKCRMSGLSPDAVVLVATIRALKYHGGVEKEDLGKEDTDALEKGFPNLMRHWRNITEVFGLPCVIAVNSFPTDTDAEREKLLSMCRENGMTAVMSEVYSRGSKGGTDLAEKVLEEIPSANGVRFSYDLDETIEKKLEDINRKIYGGEGVEFSEEALGQLEMLNECGYSGLPVCVAKTQYSFSDNPKLRNAPAGVPLHVRSLRISGGAGFIVAITGRIMTMPGLPKQPAAEKIDIDGSGKITGLF
ncbi:MAG: formate--tetrahydrofolate ligase [Oscillospiraceae bacterium]|jgi:formate--tetrahydrofolate ligase